MPRWLQYSLRPTQLKPPNFLRISGRLRRLAAPSTVLRGPLMTWHSDARRLTGAPSTGVWSTQPCIMRPSPAGRSSSRVADTAWVIPIHRRNALMHPQGRDLTATVAHSRAVPRVGALSVIADLVLRSAGCSTRRAAPGASTRSAATSTSALSAGVRTRWRSAGVERDANRAPLPRPRDHMRAPSHP